MGFVAQVSVMSEPVLLPKTNRWDRASRRRWYEGSSLAVRDGWLFWTPPGGGEAGRWRLKVGSAPGQAARLTHVQADMVLGARGGSIMFDAYAVLDSAGSLLAKFAADTNGSAISWPMPWFPPDRVASFASAAGLTFEAVQIVRPQELAAQYPGLYRHTTTALWLSYINPLVFALGCVGFTWVVIFNWMNPKPSDGFVGSLLMGLFMLLVALFFGGTAVVMFPPVFGRVVARAKRHHPERFPRQ
jgi:hypothetical protein